MSVAQAETDPLARRTFQFPNPRAVQDIRRTLLALLATAMGVVPLGELITDSGWLLDVWLTMVIVIAPAALLRLRRPPSAGQIWTGLVLLVPWLTVRFLHQHAIIGFIPGGRSWHDLARLMSSLHHTTTVEAAPVHSTTAIKLALCMLLGLVAALVDLVAVVGRRSALGGIPLLVVFTVSGAVPRAPVSWWLFAIAAGGFLILLALDSSDELHRWGHYVPRAHALKTNTAATGQRIAVIAIAFAVILPAFIPSDSRNFLANLFHDGNSNGLDTGIGRLGGTGGIDPFIALKGQLERKVPTNLFDVTVESRSGDTVGPAAHTQLFYARTNVLSHYTGKGWTVGDQGPVENISTTQFTSEPGVSFPPDTTGFAVHVKVTNLHSNPPVFAYPTAVNGLSSSTSWSPQDGLLENSTISPGDAYDMEVAQPSPSIDELNAADGPVGPDMSPWLQRPPVAEYVQTLVARLTGEAATPYAKARAISDYFNNPSNDFRYSLATQPGDTGDELVDFLQHKVGYCQQYAASMAVMLRVAGVPARVVLGYTHAVPSAQDGTFTVTTNDAHSWVEAYFSGFGWIPFDPTPLAGITGGAANDLPWAKHRNGDPGANDHITPTISRPVPTGPSAPSNSVGGGGNRSANGGHGSALTGSLLATGILALILVLVFTPWAVRQRRRSTRLRRARHGDVDALWAEFSDTARDLGYGWSDARTPRQVAQWLDKPVGSAAPALREMTASVERTRYAPVGAADPATEGRRLVHDLSAVRSGLQEGRTWGERAAARLFPTSLGWRIVAVIRGIRRH